MRFVTLMLVGIVIATQSAGAAIPADLVQASLVADVSSVKPGQPFTLGVLLKIKPGWHVYWKNPGESGMATSVKWKLPKGFKASELKFPIPVNFGGGGQVTGYGYKDEVLLTTTITPPSDLKQADGLPFAADVAWLVCEKVCIPGKAKVNLELPIGDGSNANEDLFAKWNPQFPRPSADYKDTIQQTGLNPSGNSAFVKFAHPVTDIEWFPVPPESSGIEKLQTSTVDAVSTITFDLVPAPVKGAPMSFLIVFTDPNGKRQGAEFTVNLPPAKDK